MSYGVVLGKLGGIKMSDYRIEQDGTLVTLLSERSTQRGIGPKPMQGWRIAFKSKYETAEFVLAGEAEGFTFEGKEFLAGIMSANVVWR
jgi:hypothetical protein